MIRISRLNINDIGKQYLEKLKVTNRRRRLTLRTYYLDNFDRIILAKPNELESIIAEFHIEYNGIGNEEQIEFKTYMENQYNTIINDCGSWLANSLDIKVCPYCNRQYTFTINTPEKKTRPQFDHYHNKSNYPFLALSFYNLIPSCPTCNLLKHTDKIGINPYIEGFESNCKFKIRNIENLLLTDDSTTDSWSIILNHEGSRKHKENIDSLALLELYNQHKDYVSEIVVKARCYNEGYYNSLKESFTNLNLTEGEMDTLIFGTYLELSKHEKRPLSKLTKDIVEDILNRRY